MNVVGNMAARVLYITHKLLDEKSAGSNVNLTLNERCDDCGTIIVFN